MYGGIIHCFSYSPEIAAGYLENGAVSGNRWCCYIQKCQKAEGSGKAGTAGTDPFGNGLPVAINRANRGKRNSSLNLSYVAAAVAQLKDTTPEEVITITEANAQKLLLTT